MTLMNKSLITALSFLFVMAVSPVSNAAQNPFGMTEMSANKMQLAGKEEGKCDTGKCGEGKCGDSMKKDAKEGKCGEGKCGDSMKKGAKEGKCGDSKKAEPKEGKCGGSN